MLSGSCSVKKILIHCLWGPGENDYQLLDESEQNIRIICQWRAISYLPMPKAEANNWLRDTDISYYYIMLMLYQF